MMSYQIRTHHGKHPIEDAAVLDHAIRRAKELSLDGATIIMVYDRDTQRVRARARCGKANWVKPCACTVDMVNEYSGLCKCGGFGHLVEDTCVV